METIRDSDSPLPPTTLQVTVPFARESMREQLLDRRRRLEGAIGGPARSERLVTLLREVDSALQRIDQGTYGLCDVCHEPVERDRLMVDPLLRYCLDHLTEAQQRALQQDLDLTARIQHTLLPKRHLTFDGWETCYHYEPLGPASGDYCDLITAETGELLFLLGDIAGKGVAASVLMAHLHAIFRSLIALHLPFEDLMARANRIFCESIGGLHYATLICGRAGAGGALEICNAGHCPPLWLGSEGATTLAASGPPIGLFSTSPYDVDRITLSPGDSLLLYTDGLTDSVDASGIEYGADRLIRSAVERRQLAGADLIAGCLQDLSAFRAGADRLDDLTVLVVKRS